MNADYKLFHVYQFSQHDNPEYAQHDAIARFLGELGPERVISLTQTKLTITVWFWAQEPKIRNDISKVRCSVVGVSPTFIPPIAPRKGEAMCGIK